MKCCDFVIRLRSMSLLVVSCLAAPVDAYFARRPRQGAGADPAASGATRVTGTMNFKTKYTPECRVAAITATDRAVLPA